MGDAEAGILFGVGDLQPVGDLGGGVERGVGAEGKVRGWRWMMTENKGGSGCGGVMELYWACGLYRNMYENDMDMKEDDDSSTEEKSSRSTYLLTSVQEVDQQIAITEVTDRLAHYLGYTVRPSSSSSPSSIMPSILLDPSSRLLVILPVP